MYCVERAGSEPAVLCLHGFCQSSTYWAPTVERLAERGVRALAPDLPGFGASADLPGPFTMTAYADRLSRWLDEQGLARVSLVGGSMGGVVAQQFAVRHPDRLVNLLLVATGAVTADPAAALERADAIEAGAWDEEAVAPIVAGFFHALPAEIGTYRRIALMASQRAAAQAARSNASGRTLELLDRIAAPTLIIQGEHDRVRTPEHGAEICERMPDARLVVLHGAGHTPQLEVPGTFHEYALPHLLAEH